MLVSNSLRIMTKLSSRFCISCLKKPKLLSPKFVLLNPNFRRDIETFVVNNFGPKPRTYREFFGDKSILDQQIEKCAKELEIYRFTREFEPLCFQDFSELICNKDEKRIHAINAILSEYEYLKYASDLPITPKTLSLDDMKSLLLIESSEGRQKFFQHLYKKEITKVVRQFMKEKLQDQKRKRDEEKFYYHKTRNGIFDSKTGDLLRGLWHNSMFTRFNESKIRANGKLATSKLRNAAFFGQKIIIDLSMLKHFESAFFNAALKHCGFAFDCNRVQTIEGNTRYLANK